MRSRQLSIHVNNPKTVIRYLATSFTSNNSNEDETTDTSIYTKKKTEKFDEKVRQQRHHANNLFKLLTSSLSKSDLKKVEDNSLSPTNDVVKTERDSSLKIDSDKTSNIASMLNELIRSAESFETQKKQNIEFIKPKQKHDIQLIKNLKKEKDRKTLLESIKEIASNVGGDVKKTEEELMNAFQFSSGKTNKKSVNFSDLKNFIDEMKVDSQVEKSEDTVLLIHNSLRMQTSSKTDGNKKKLFSSNKRLNIFSEEILEDKDTEDINLQIWNHLEKISLLELKATPPRNYFQELMVWTQQGKLWHFPIDNEQGLDEEKKIHFSEHIFLDEYLEPWCPPGGPLRHFMELVTTALSKNSYLSINEKKEHLMWYKSYFENKKKVLVELGAVSETNQIESGHKY